MSPVRSAPTEAQMVIMRATVVEAFGKPLSTQAQKVPVPGPGQVLKTEASGDCHIDLHAARADCPVPLFDVAKCVIISGSCVGTWPDMAEALAFATEGRVHADIEPQPLSAVSVAIDFAVAA